MTRGGLALIAANALFGSLSVTTTIALRGFGPLTTLLAELVVAIVVLSTVCAIRRQPLPRPTPPLLVLGLLQPTVAFLSFTLGVQRTSSTHAGVLLSLETVFVVLLGVLMLHERPGSVAGVGIAVALGGVVLLTTDGGGRASTSGDVLVVIDAAAAALAVILTIRLAPLTHAAALTAAQFIIGAVIIGPIWIITVLTGHEQAISPRVSPAAVWGVLATGVLGTAGAFLVYNWALGRVTATAAGASVTLIPLFALALSHVVLGEGIGRLAMLSVVLILTGLLSLLRPIARRDG